MRVYNYIFHTMEATTEQTISYAEMSRYCRKREHLHNALSRDGWILPSKHAAICTTDWMLKVREGNIFCINTNLEDFKIKVCFSPPPR